MSHPPCVKRGLLSKTPRVSGGRFLPFFQQFYHLSTLFRVGIQNIVILLRVEFHVVQKGPAVAQLLAEREPLYRKSASIIVDTSSKSIEDIVAEIIQALPSDFAIDHPPAGDASA